MPEPTKIPRAFAASGDKNSIPDSSGSPGFASWQEGFPAITSEPFAQGGIAPKRADFNGIFNALSLATVWQQQGGVYAYDNVTDYEVGNLVEDSGDIYQCMVANGPNSTIKSPSDQTVWSKLMNVTDVNSVLSSYLPLSGGTLTGDLLGANVLKLTASDSAHETWLCGGTSLSDGATIIVYGKDNGSGIWRLRAYGNHDLIGKPDGTLTWDGKDVEVVSAKTFSTEGYVYYKSGLQICFGVNVSPTTGGTGNTVTYPRAFKTAPFALVCRRSGASTTGTADPPWIREPNSTTMNIYVPVYTGYYWLAIGEGA